MLAAAVLGFLLTEAATFYAYASLWFTESQPQRHGDPTLKALAWVCIGAALAWFFVLLYSVVLIYRRLP